MYPNPLGAFLRLLSVLLSSGGMIFLIFFQRE
jgi:hypothetical protein